MNLTVAKLDEAALRDWFAAQALIGILAGPLGLEFEPRHKIDAERVAAWAYQHADAMLKMRVQA
jgi:hypothetical protein